VHRSDACPSWCSSTQWMLRSESCPSVWPPCTSANSLHSRRPVCRESARLRPSGHGLAVLAHVGGDAGGQPGPRAGPSTVTEPEHDCLDLQPAGPRWDGLAQRPGIALWSPARKSATTRRICTATACRSPPTNWGVGSVRRENNSERAAAAAALSGRWLDVDPPVRGRSLRLLHRPDRQAAGAQPHDARVWRKCGEVSEQLLPDSRLILLSGGGRGEGGEGECVAGQPLNAQAVHFSTAHVAGY
jgi:hypothetical protein